MVVPWSSWQVHVVLSPPQAWDLGQAPWPWYASATSPVTCSWQWHLPHRVAVKMIGVSSHTDLRMVPDTRVMPDACSLLLSDSLPPAPRVGSFPPLV